MQDENFLYAKDLSKENPYYKEILGKIVWFQKISNNIQLDIIFIIDSLIPKYKTKPSDYFNYLLKFSGKNSLIYQLKKQKLAIKLDAGVSTSINKLSHYTVSIALTEKGFADIEKVIELVFDYIIFIKTTEISVELFNELKQIKDSNFRFLEKNGYGSYLASIAGAMFDFEYRDILKGDSTIDHFNKTEILNFADSLNIENSLIILGSKKKPNNNTLDKFFSKSTTKIEQWYGTNFMDKKLSEKYLQKFSNLTKNAKNNFEMRKHNNFITNLTFPTTCNVKLK